MRPGTPATQAEQVYHYLLTFFSCNNLCAWLLDCITSKGPAAMLEGEKVNVVRGVLPLEPCATLLRRTEIGDTLSGIPLSILHAELQRRQDGDEKPACGRSGSRGSYNMGAHVFALFLILILSTLGKYSTRMTMVY